MRRFIFATLLGLVISTNVGCFLPAYSPEPSTRAKQLIFSAEDMRVILEEWERFWFLDQPDHMSPFRTHGGLI